MSLGNALLRELNLIAGGGMMVFACAAYELRLYAILAAGGLVQEVGRENGVNGWVDYRITPAGDALLAACAADPVKFLIQPEAEAS